MMRTVKGWLVAFGLWLVHVGGWQAFALPPDLERLLALARRLIAEAESMPGSPSGEAKRHRVLAQMLKHGVRERDAALVIEVVIHAG